jgi:hypothetical protein
MEKSIDIYILAELFFRFEFGVLVSAFVSGSV